VFDAHAQVAAAGHSARDLLGDHGDAGCEAGTTGGAARARGRAHHDDEEVGGGWAIVLHP